MDLVPPVLFKTSSQRDVEEITRKLEDKQRQRKKKRYNLHCKLCKNLITDSTLKIEVNDHYLHYFTNPAGISFKIGCFSKAPGCIVQGTPTKEYTFFPGYSWCYALCSQCFSHLGWYYQTQDHHFYGLILNNLVEIINNE